MVRPSIGSAARLAVTIVVACASVLPGTSLAGNGDPVDGNPGYRERALLALTNACRQDPVRYRETFLGNVRILHPRHYPAVPPLYASPALGRSARAHSRDMARNGCFQHESCDGTDLWERMAKFDKHATVRGENIAQGFPTPLETVNGWLLDGGAPDGSPGDGHRMNIMHPGYREVGHGSIGGDRGVCDTQDFGNATPVSAAPLVSGSHLLDDARTITFLASWHARDGRAPGEAALEIDGTERRLVLAFGTKASGTWRVVLPEESDCRRYRFRFRDASGRIWHYPEGGTLFTTGEGGCSQEYEAHSSTAQR
jgi:hypothetical protein